MQFKDAAYEILKKSGEALHYSEITDKALEKGILTTSGQTPHATMGALLYTDTLKENSRFLRGDRRGTFRVRTEASEDILFRVQGINVQVRNKLRKRLLLVEPRQFELLVQNLLDVMGLQDTAVTTYGGDGGIDVRGVLNAENLSQISVAVQAKRWKNNVGAKTVRELRGSIKVHEHGIIITPSDFTPSAKSEADEAGKVRISLINGEQLADLLIKHQVGVASEELVVHTLDEDYWSDILGENHTGSQENKPSKKRVSEKDKVSFPLKIQAKHKGTVYHAELLSLEGSVRYDGMDYETPSAAALTIVDWSTVNGWDFWKYNSPLKGKLTNIGSLR